MADEKDAEWQEARREALAMLQSALFWHLHPARWEQVQQVLTQVAAAVSGPAPAALWEATETLSFYAPTRVATKLGDNADKAQPVPHVVREQIAELVDTLQPPGVQGDAAGQAGKRGA